ncbi:MAG: hypothetical protein NCW75_10685 [Phycisphaera sp.]|nr:MAG: hypothetical protein NCW75_10685 [Phycisphaera sp.]
MRPAPKRPDNTVRRDAPHGSDVRPHVLGIAMHVPGATPLLRRPAMRVWLGAPPVRHPGPRALGGAPHAGDPTNRVDRSAAQPIRRG